MAIKDGPPPAGKKTKKEKRRERKAAEASTEGAALKSAPPPALKRKADSSSSANETAVAQPDAASKRARVEALSSGRRVFVGQLQQSTTAADLQTLLAAECGEVVHVEMMVRKKSKGSAFVEFALGESASKAMSAELQLGGKAIVIKRAKAESKPSGAEPGASVPQALTKALTQALTAKGKAEPSPTSVFVSGLPLEARKGEVREAFAECGEVKRVKMLSADPADGGARCFVDFHTYKHAKLAVAMSGDKVLGREVKVSYSIKQASAPAAGDPKGTPTKKRMKAEHRKACRCPKCAW